MVSARAAKNQVELEILIRAGIQALSQAGIENSRLDTEILIAAALGVSRADLLTGSCGMSASRRERYLQMLGRRAQREPLAYIIGRREFYSIDFEVSRAVLIPRPETETVVDAAIDFLSNRPNARVVDIGTGSGAIALAIASKVPDALVVATDISAGALAIAYHNIGNLKYGERVELRQADCWTALDKRGPLGSFDLVVSNPPYIRDGDVAGLQPEVANYEPKLALCGGTDGLDFYRRIANEINAHLKPGGALIAEVGDGQADAVAGIFREAGLYDPVYCYDLRAVPRAVFIHSAVPRG